MNDRDCLEEIEQMEKEGQGLWKYERKQISVRKEGQEQSLEQWL